MIVKSSERFKYIVDNFWKHYKQLEKEFILMGEYIEIAEDNFITYSYKLSVIFQSICSEIDVVGKAMAYELDKNDAMEKASFYIWWTKIQYEYLFSDSIKLKDASVMLLDTIQIMPWNSIKDNANKNNNIPQWWSEYNIVKHRRISATNSSNNYKKANLKNVCNSIAALYILEKSYMYTIGTEDDIQRFYDKSKLFEKEQYMSSSDVDLLLDYM